MQTRKYTKMAAPNVTVPIFFIAPPTRVNDTHKVYSIAGAIILIGVVTSLLVGVRLTYRFWKKNQGPDDYAIILSLVSMRRNSRTT